MDGGIYLMDGDSLIEMTEEQYDSERILQESLADFPRLLAGDQMTTDDARRWALVAREAAVPDKEGGGDRWSADHLFVDQAGVPTIVEVKRSDDTRIRREVVGQMLDYVAHASIYWNGSDLQDRFIETCEERGTVPEQLLSELTGDEETDGFWEQVQTNLRSGNIRLLFVADAIPSELKRVVEFLNEQMSSTEVLAVEVTQYVDEQDNLKAFVPRLHGQTEEARSAKRSTARPTHDEEDLLNDLREKERSGVLSAAEAAAVRDIYDFIQTEADAYDFGGSANVSVTARWEVLGGSKGMFTLNSGGHIDFWQPSPDADGAEWGETELEEWYDALGAIDHPSIDREKFDTQQKIQIVALTDESNRSQFKAACRQFAQACEQAADESFV
ncbi:hypothetical protein [Haladaptatus sp. ZSTT2]|uniref:hypothetical protein n=1 Tax=Haladaptatus sp. ZSTT2 TaxID=3120515 RepID=UPI00300F71FF